MAECWADDNNFYNVKGYLYEEHDQENDFHGSVFCLLAASLTGCGSETVTEIAQTDALSQQEIPNRVMEAPEMTPDQVEVPEEDVQELIQAGLNAVMEESDARLL